MITKDSNWGGDVLQFLSLCSKHKVRMIMVGGGVVTFMVIKGIQQAWIFG